MKTIVLRTWIFTALVWLASTVTLKAGTVEVLGIKISNLGMGGRMIRFGDDGIFLDDAGMHLEGVVNLKINVSSTNSEQG